MRVANTRTIKCIIRLSHVIVLILKHVPDVKIYRFMMFFFVVIDPGNLELDEQLTISYGKFIVKLLTLSVCIKTLLS